MTLVRLRSIAFGVLATIASVSMARAQSAPMFRVTFDTVTAKAGDTVTVFARYVFDSSGSHHINSYSAHIDWDTSELHLLAFVLDGTATPPSDTLGLAGTSHHGITADGSNEIDLSNPILFGIRFLTDKRLGDTAFIRWDTTILMFDPSEGAGTVVRNDGWVRTPAPAAHVVIRVPGHTASGYSNGYSPDSVQFSLPFLVSDLSAATMTSAQLTFDYDPSQLTLSGAVGDSVIIDSVSSTPLFGGLDSASIVFTSQSGLLSGNDTLLNAVFIGLVGMDSVCQEFSNIQLRALNAFGLIGNTDYIVDSVCVKFAPLASVATSSTSKLISIYPNPASSEVRMEMPERDAEDEFSMYDALGVRVWTGKLSGASWSIPPVLANGVYSVAIAGKTEVYRSMLVIER